MAATHLRPRASYILHLTRRSTHLPSGTEPLIHATRTSSRIPLRTAHSSTNSPQSTPLPTQSQRRYASRLQRPPKPGPPASHDRGPKSDEDTQTDFSALNVLGATPAPATSIDVCAFDGFQLDNGLRVLEGDGVLLVAGEAFVWRPWMAKPLNEFARERGVVSGSQLRTLEREAGGGERVRTGGVLNDKGVMSIDAVAWGLLSLVWPKPELLVLGTGRMIRPLSKETRQAIQELGVRIELLDTRNAASHFNLLATERGTQEVAAALLPLGFGEK